MNVPASRAPRHDAVSEEQTAREEELIERVVKSFQGTTDARLQELLAATVRHLHALFREVRITELEWSELVQFLTDVGHASDAWRQEFILLSDVLGLSMQMISINNEAHANATEATVLGPFFLEESPEIELGEDIAFGAAGEPCWVEGQVTDEHGQAVGDALLEVWEADEEGRYDVQYAVPTTAGRAKLRTGGDGSYRFWALTPTPYPIPNDGPVGRLLKVSSRSPMRASHLHFRVSSAGFRTLVTHIFVADDDYLKSDAVFGVKASLIKEFQLQATGTPTPDGRDLAGQSWSRVRFDIVLAPASTSATNT